jgi:hypothetical protein
VRVVYFLDDPLFLVNVAGTVLLLILIVIIVLPTTILLRSTAGRTASQFSHVLQSLGSGLPEVRAGASDSDFEFSCGRLSGAARDCGLAMGKSVLPVAVGGSRWAPNKATGVIASTNGRGELTAAGARVPEAVVVVGRVVVVILIVAGLDRLGHLATGLIDGGGRSGTLGSALAA